MLRLDCLIVLDDIKSKSYMNRFPVNLSDATENLNWKPNGKMLGFQKLCKKIKSTIFFNIESYILTHP